MDDWTDIDRQKMAIVAQGMTPDSAQWLNKALNAKVQAVTASSNPSATAAAYDSAIQAYIPKVKSGGTNAETFNSFFGALGTKPLPDEWSTPQYVPGIGVYQANRATGESRTNASLPRTAGTIETVSNEDGQESGTIIHQPDGRIIFHPAPKVQAPKVSQEEVRTSTGTNYTERVTGLPYRPGIRPAGGEFRPIQIRR